MILETYQSSVVLDILNRGEIYRAKPSISFKREYAALVDMLGLQCECPVFAVVKGKKQNTDGRVSGTVKLTLDVPDDKIKLTEYPIWADFLYFCKYSKPGDYTKLEPNCEEISIREYAELIKDMKNQRPLDSYTFPQALIEEIQPQWLMKSMVSQKNDGIVEKLMNIFRK